MKKKIFVTGAEGFIGSHLIESLVSKGFKVKALVLYNFRNTLGWIDTIDKKYLKRIEIIQGDIKDFNFLVKNTKDCETLFHLAALISIPYSYISPKSFIDTNIIGTYNVLEASRINKLKNVIITSTSEVYGTAQFVPITENHSLNAQSPYAATKIAADQLALSYYRSFNLPVTIIRPFNTFGPRQSLKAIIPTIISQALSGKVVKLGDLSPTRDFLYVKDTANAFISCLNNKNITGQVINIGNGFEVSIKNILDILKKDFNLKFKYVADKKRIRPKKSEVFRLLSSNKKANKLLKWKPKYNGLTGFKKALKKTIEWYAISENLKKFNENVYNI
jgi:NAD dependent epimerase/dehydratase